MSNPDATPTPESGSVGAPVKSRRATGIPSLLFGAGAVLLVTLFVGAHEAELGALPGSVRRLGAVIRLHGVLRLSEVAQGAVGVVVAALIVTAWFGLGTVLVRLARAAPGAVGGEAAGSSRALSLAWACALGAGAWSMLWLVLGLAGLYDSVTALITLAVGLVLAAVAWRRGRGGSAAPSSGDGRVPPAALLVAAPVAMALAAALAPPTAKDALQYHLALPKVFVAAGGLVDVPGNLASHFALGAEMQGLWAMLIGRVVSGRAGEAAFQCVMFAFFPLLLAVVLGWTRERGLRGSWPWLAAAMVASVPTIAEVAGGGYVDLALALYVLLAVRGAARWVIAGDRTSLALAALALGFALGVKLTAVFVVLVLGLLVLLRARATARDGSAPFADLRAGAAALGVVLAVGCPWYLRTWVRTGSPVFPFFATIWPGHAAGWDVERSVMLHEFNATYGGADKGWLDYLWTPVRLSLMGQREVAALYEGVLGVSFLIGAVLLLWALARRALDPELKVAAAAGGAFFAWWLLSAQVLRYLVPALGPLAVAVAGAGAGLAARRDLGRAARWGLGLGVVLAEVLTLAWFVGDNPLLAAMGAEPRAAYLDRRLEYHPYYRLIDESLPPGVTIWLVDVRRDTYHLERPYVGDYLFEDYTLRQWVETARSGEEVRRRALARGITHVLIRHDVLFDEARSPLVDDRLPREENAARLARLRAFLTEGTRVLRADRRYALVELASRP